MFGKKKPKISKDRYKLALGDKEEPDTRARAPRESAWATCRLTWSGGPGDQGVLLDISQTGARVRFNHRPGLPQFVRLDINTMSVSVDAEVVRVDGVDVGLRFLEPV
ncbi:MAG: PilZ domain-containing protein [Pseudomonadota bacterium]